MKSKPTADSVEGICKLLRHGKLLSSQEIADLQERWQREAIDPASRDAFTSWLVAQRYVTEYQVTMLLDGNVDHFFFGPYKLLERIGKGKNARVYKGVDRLGQVVALKVLPPSRGRDVRALARFQLEARLGKLSNHPNTVRYLDSGNEGSLNYHVLEYLEGESLLQRLERQGPLAPPEGVDILLQGLAAVRHLHEIGCLHRNLEPANLMLVRPALRPPEGDPERPLVKVVDLTLASSLNDPPSTDDDLARLGATAYQAPELARGVADPRSDVFSLGLILVHALTGRPPVAGKNPLESAPEVPPVLAEIIERMTASNPEKRCDVAAALLSLEEVVAQANVQEVDVEPVAWPEPPPAEPLAFEPVEPPSFPALEVPALPQEAPLPVPVVRPRRLLPLDRRDWMLLLVGSVALLGIQIAAWVAGRLLSLVPRRAPVSENER